MSNEKKEVKLPKNFWKKKPCSSRCMASVAVAAPGNSGRSNSCAAATKIGVAPGDTPNIAPADLALRTCVGVSSVPTPAIAPSTSAIAAIASSAASVRRVISKAGKPPATKARAKGWASSSRSIVKTGMTGAVAQTLAIISEWVIGYFLCYDARALNGRSNVMPEHRE